MAAMAIVAQTVLMREEREQTSSNAVRGLENTLRRLALSVALTPMTTRRHFGNASPRACAAMWASASRTFMQDTTKRCSCVARQGGSQLENALFSVITLKGDNKE